jgi:hypothetical protein
LSAPARTAPYSGKVHSKGSTLLDLTMKPNLLIFPVDSRLRDSALRRHKHADDLTAGVS